MIETDLKSGSGGSGSDAISALYSVLRHPLVTVESVEEFSFTNDGFNAWSTLDQLPSSLLTETVILSIQQSYSAYIATEYNAVLRDQLKNIMVGGDWLFTDVVPTGDVDARSTAIGVMSDAEFSAWITTENSSEAYNLVRSQEAWRLTKNSIAKCNSFAENSFFMTILSASRHGMDVVAHDAECMAVIANSAIAVTAISKNFSALTSVASNIVSVSALFGVMSARTIIWDVGGKRGADAFLNNSHSLNWLKENVMITSASYTLAQTATPITISRKKGYLLDVAVYGTNYKSVVGNFVGDNYLGSHEEVWGYIPVYNERVNQFTLGSIGSNPNSQYVSSITYIEMEA